MGMAHHSDLEIPTTPPNLSTMSEKGHTSKNTREERLAANLRANLRRRKQAARKAKTPPANVPSEDSPNPDKPSP